MSTLTVPDTAMPDAGAARPARTGAQVGAAAGGAGDGRRPHLRLVTPPPSRAATWRRRAAAVVLLVGLLLLVAAGLGRIGASAELTDRVDGHVVIEPGQTLWEVAVATAPDGVDPREQLLAIEELNGVRASEVDAWTVVLLPAR